MCAVCGFKPTPKFKAIELVACKTTQVYTEYYLFHIYGEAFYGVQMYKPVVYA